MTQTIKQEIERCIEEFRRGELTEESLRRLMECADSEAPKRQDLLYLQTGSTSLNSAVHGMLLVQNGKVLEGPADPDEWPYKTVLDAIMDGWRVIQFPNLALMMDENRTYGLGCEFILERWNR